MRDLNFTFFKNAQIKLGTLKIKSWPSWIKILKCHKVRGSILNTSDESSLNKEKNGPAVLLGEIPVGVARSANNVLAAHALALDIENQSDKKIELVLKKLLNYEYFLYTTHKHGSVVAQKFARLRVILPLQTPIPNAGYRQAWQAFNTLCDNINDPQTKDISRLHFLPSTFDISVAYTIHNKGKWISIEDLKPFYKKEELPYTNMEPILNKLQAVKKIDPLKPIAKALIEGSSFAPAHHRHEAILKITMWLAQKDLKLSDVALETLFKNSLEVMKNPPKIKEIIDAYRGATEKVKDLNKQQRLGKHTQYSQAELEFIAKKQNCTVSELEKKWIIQSGGGGWILRDNGNYTPLQSYRDIDVAVKLNLRKAPIDLLKATQTGVKSKSLTEVVLDYGNLSETNIADMRAQISYFDTKRRAMIEAVCPIRSEITPVYDEQIDHWLKLLGGPQYQKLIDWMSVCSDLNKLLCAIYFNARKGSGKNMFAYGLARLWTTSQPAELELVLSDFNETLTKCPLIFADEQLPRKYRWESITPQLRSMLSVVSRTLKRKHKPPSELQGAIRLIMAANNEFLLDSNEVATRSDLEAIAERFLYVKIIDSRASDFLAKLGKEIVGPWWFKGIPEHALWLRDNHKIEKPGARFEVEGDLSQMHRLLMTGSMWNSLTCEWLVRYMEEPHSFDVRDSGLIRIENQKLLVNEQALIDGWDLYIKSKQDPIVPKIGAALRAMAESPEKKQLRWKNKRIRYRVIDVAHLLAWADRYNIGDKETILNRLNQQADLKNVISLDNIKKEEEKIKQEKGEADFDY